MQARVVLDGKFATPTVNYVVTAGVLCILLAFVLDVALLTVQRLALPWQRLAR